MKKILFIFAYLLLSIHTTIPATIHTTIPATIPAADAKSKKSSITYGNPFTSKQLTDAERFKYILVTPEMSAGIQLDSEINPSFLDGNYTFDLSDQKQMIDDGITILKLNILAEATFPPFFLMLDYQGCFDAQGIRKKDTNPTIVGMIEFSPPGDKQITDEKPDAIYVYCFAINQFLQRNGYGKKLFNNFETFIKKNKWATKIFLFSLPSAKDFWKTMGFKNMQDGSKEKTITP